MWACISTHDSDIKISDTEKGYFSMQGSSITIVLYYTPSLNCITSAAGCMKYLKYSNYKVDIIKWIPLAKIDYCPVFYIV